MKVFTLGYQGITLSQYIDHLNSMRIGIVLDVRENPWSYKKGFARHDLQPALADQSIEYAHVRSAGNPSFNRKTAANAQECLERYRDYLKRNNGCLVELFEYISRADKAGRPACLTCFELKPGDCHRSILIDALTNRHPDLECIDLPVVTMPIKAVLKQATLF